MKTRGKNNPNPVLGKLSPSTNEPKGVDIKSLQTSFVNHLEFSLAKDKYSATQRDFLKSLVLTVRDRLIERWIETQQTYYKVDAKRIYYISMEYMIGKMTGNTLINLDLYDNMKRALFQLGINMEDIEELEYDAGLGNGGLGRLAACFLDSMATLQLPAYGYGIRYEYGIFTQKIIDGFQIETPEGWLRYGNPWEIERPEFIYLVKFYGKVKTHKEKEGRQRNEWVDTENIVAMAHDTPIPGYHKNTVNNLRLWSAKATREFNLEYFNHGDYEKAVLEKIESETLSKVLYPRDDTFKGKELRLKQEYFLVSASLQDIVRRYKKIHADKFKKFADKVAIQLNDTHPSLAIPELMRILIDQEKISWEAAWEITVKTFGFTNHTLLPEALEKWPVSLLEYLLPRHLQIIYEINQRFLQLVGQKYPKDMDRLKRMSLIEEGDEKRVNMAHLSIIGSHSVNGVAELHSRLVKEVMFKDFHELYPGKFNNKTNGISQRTWLKVCNPGLSKLISEKIGDGWITDLRELKKLEPYINDKTVQKKWRQVKLENKKNLAECIKKKHHIEIDIHSLFDCQTKRIHEYKRQLLNVFHVITLYNKLKSNPELDIVPRTVIFSGKSAPGYTNAKLIIKLINAVADTINQDTSIDNKLKVIFIPNYSVSIAQKIIPAADLSEQISTAGMEASGTGNMKYALNGALTIGTLDGSNIEIINEVGNENIFTFGLTEKEVMNLRKLGNNPLDYYHKDSELKQVLDMITNGYFSVNDRDLFKSLIYPILYQGDYYMLLSDYHKYIECQKRISRVYKDQTAWTKMSIINVANMGVFSSDRTIQEYAKEIWDVKSVKIKNP
jgi:starch phosphorylase